MTHEPELQTLEKTHYLYAHRSFPEGLPSVMPVFVQTVLDIRKFAAQNGVTDDGAAIVVIPDIAQVPLKLQISIIAQPEAAGICDHEVCFGNTPTCKAVIIKHKGPLGLYAEPYRKIAAFIQANGLQKLTPAWEVILDPDVAGSGQNALTVIHTPVA